MTNTAPTDAPFFYTWTAQRDARPMAITGGEGAIFYTADGAHWLDFASLSYQANLGHGHPRMIEAIQRQAATLCLAPPTATFPAKFELAELLLERAPAGFSKVFYTNGGSEAVENAIKLARMVTGRYKLVSRYRSYHGATFGALTLSGDFRRSPLEPGLTGVVHALECYLEDFPSDSGALFGRPDAIVDMLEREGPERVAAIVLEPIPGANGVLVPPPGYWRAVRDACDQHGVLLIVDEVLNGFGRTGRWFGFEHFDDVVPDMIVTSKGLTGGYAPLGAVLVHEHVARHFDDTMLFAGLTYYAHPLGCAAGAEALRVYADEGLIARADQLATPILHHALALRTRFPELIQHVRSIGMLTALELTTHTAWDTLMRHIHAQHLLIHARASDRTLILSPPLCLTDTQLHDGFRRLEHALHAWRAAGPLE